MKNSILTSIIILFLMFSCKKKEAEKLQISQEKPPTEIKIVANKKNAELVNKEQYIVNENLLDKLESDLKKLVSNNKFALKIERVSNKHNENVTDTIKTFTFEKSKIEIYKAGNMKKIYAARIENTDLKFLDSIEIGTNKISFANRIKTELKTDLIKIGNLERTSVFVFSFANNSLNKIEYQGYVD